MRDGSRLLHCSVHQADQMQYGYPMFFIKSTPVERKKDKGFILNDKNKIKTIVKYAKISPHTKHVFFSVVVPKVIFVEDSF